MSPSACDPMPIACAAHGVLSLKKCAHIFLSQGAFCPERRFRWWAFCVHAAWPAAKSTVHLCFYELIWDWRQILSEKELCCVDVGTSDTQQEAAHLDLQVLAS